MLIFVYGTLLRGLERHTVIERSDWKGLGMMGADMFDIGDYPGAIEGSGVVIGELYDVDRGTISLLDEIEEYDEDDLERSDFIRRPVNVTLLSDGRSIGAACYFYNGHERGEFIDHGDYRRHRLESGGGLQWVVCYGSNLDVSRLAERVGRVEEMRRVQINGFELVFNKVSKDGVESYANIRYVGGGFCPGVAFKLSEEQIAKLDVYEGVNSGEYLRIGMPFEDEFGNDILAHVYVASPNRLNNELRPSDWYVEHIRKGYENFGFDVSYLEGVLSNYFS